MKDTLVRLARLFIVLLGVAGTFWGMATFPIFWYQLPIERTAAAILDYGSFKSFSFDALLPAVHQIEQSIYCRPEALRSAAVIRLRLAEDAMASGQRDAIDARFSALEGSILRTLDCSPSDSFFWMVLAWLDDAREGPRREQLTYLRVSYRLGPHEGWVAARRNRVALSMFRRLPPDLAQAAMHEFANMVASWASWDAIAIFTGPGWPIHERLLASLNHVGQLQRDAFAKILYAQGYNVVVPGVRAPEPRPWN
ncbi:MAG TPA: hypothetical protein VMF32_11200 [Xanthobacteraceae bacterium]|nr:hypothetical protein [Xanthobacteraceae bacterium]